MRETKLLSICLLLFTSQVFGGDEEKFFVSGNVKKFTKIVDIFCTFEEVKTENGPLAGNVNWSNETESCMKESRNSSCEDRIQIFEIPEKGIYKIKINGNKVLNNFRSGTIEWDNIWVDSTTIKFNISHLNKPIQESEQYIIYRGSGKVRKIYSLYGGVSGNDRWKNLEKKYLQVRKFNGNKREDFRHKWDYMLDDIILGNNSTKIHYSSYFFGKCMQNKKNLF